MNKNYSKNWVFVAFFLSIIILYFYLYEGIFTINSWVYHASGDALKNYYHVLFSAKYSDGLWLNKVNYPFGEHLFYLDSQPLLAKIIGFFHLENYTFGIVNFLPLLAIAITTIPIFLIQRALKIPLVLNIISSIIIAFLSPQIVRIQVHFALAYSFFIPTILYLLIRKTQKYFQNYLVISLFIFSFSFLHPYYLLIGVVILVSFLPYNALVKYNKKLVFYNILAFVIPLILIKLILIFSDSIIDRPEIPYGINKYCSTVTSVFLPKFKPFAEIISSIYLFKSPTFEGNAYVGILGFPVLISSFFVVFKKNKAKENIGDYFISPLFLYILVASFIIWIFALYSPLKFIIDPVLELIPALKQFRSLGRFGWIFYYVFSIFISINIYHLFNYVKKKSNFYLAFFVVLLLYSLWYLDANGNLNLVKNAIHKRQDIAFDKSTYLNAREIEQLKANNFDAILSLPIFHIGSEIDNFHGSSSCILETFKIAYEIEKPFISTFSSRVSKAQFYKIKKLKETGSFKELLPKNQNILIVAKKESLSKTEIEILEKATILFEKDDMVFARLLIK